MARRHRVRTIGPFGGWDYLRRSITGLGFLFGIRAFIYVGGQLVIWRRLWPRASV